LDNDATERALNIFVELSQQGKQHGEFFNPRLSVKQLSQLRNFKKPSVSIVPETQLMERLHSLLAEQEQSLDGEKSPEDWDYRSDHFEQPGEVAIDCEQTHVYCQ
jgi:hypothetical protein